MSERVCVVGSINIDLVVVADRLPHPGETVLGGRFSVHDGGKGANQAVAAARDFSQGDFTYDGIVNLNDFTLPFDIIFVGSVLVGEVREQ